MTDAILTVTERAANRIKALIAAQQLEECVLRISMQERDGRPAHGITFVTAPQPGDVVFQQHDLTVAIDQPSAALLQGVVLDYEGEPGAGRFTARHPGPEDV